MSYNTKITNLTGFTPRDACGNVISPHVYSPYVPGGEVRIVIGAPIEISKEVRSPASGER